MNPEPLTPPEREPDWHGQKAKHKRETSVRKTIARSLIAGILMSILLVVVSVFALTELQNLPQASDDTAMLPSRLSPLTAAPMTLTATAQTLIKLRSTWAAQATSVAQVTQTAYYIAASWGLTAISPGHDHAVQTDFAASQTQAISDQETSEVIAKTETLIPTPTFTSIPAIAMTPYSLPMSTRLLEYVFKSFDAASNTIGPNLTLVKTLPITPTIGYSFSNIRFGPDGNLYVAHTRSQAMGACDPNEGYWIVNPGSEQLTNRVSFQSMIDPQRIAFDREHNIYIVAVDCKQHVHAVFKFDTHDQWIDTFPIVGADDIAVSNDNRILVALDGYSENNLVHPRLLELRSDPVTGHLKQMALLKIGNSAAGHFRSLLIFEQSPHQPMENYWYLVWAGEQSTDALQSTDWLPMMALEQMTSSGLLQGPIQDVHGRLQVDNLDHYGASLFGLSLDRRHAIFFQDVNGTAVQFTIPGIIANSFGIDPISGIWVIAGQPDSE